MEKHDFSQLKIKIFTKIQDFCLLENMSYFFIIHIFTLLIWGSVVFKHAIPVVGLHEQLVALLQRVLSLVVQRHPVSVLLLTQLPR